MTPSADLIRRCGRALYGARFVTPLARDLGVSRRSVHAWLSGESEPKRKIWYELRVRCLYHAAALRDARDAIADRGLGIDPEQ